MAQFCSVSSFLGLLVISSRLSVQACQIRRSGQAAKRLDSGEPTARERFVPQAHFDAGTRLDLHKETSASSALKPSDQPPREQMLF